ncbi:2-keto-3-deoxy-L-rhamnonate aldolase RhmA [Amorphus suaedae]
MKRARTEPTAAAGLRARLDAGDPIGAVWLALGSPAAAEAMTHSRPDAAVFDLQHGLWTRDRLESAIIAVSPRTIPLVRTLSSRTEDIAVALEAGAAGVIVPMVDDVETARAAVAATRYPPHGIRSAGGIRPLFDFPAHFAADQKDPPFVGVMIETVAGLEAAAEIAAVDGVDLIFIGTGDLALSLGEFPNVGARHTEAVAKILSDARSAECAGGAFSINETVGAKWRALGAQFTILASDAEALRLATTDALAQFRKAPRPKLGS